MAIAKVFGENDGISIGLIIALLTAASFGVSWGLRLESKLEVAVSRISGAEEQRKEDLESTRLYTRTLQEVNTRLARIEGSLGINDGKQKGQ